MGRGARAPVAIEMLIALFYADDALVGSRDPSLLQAALDILSEIFERLGLLTNTKKTKCMTCVLVKIRVRLSRSSYNRRQT